MGQEKSGSDGSPKRATWTGGWATLRDFEILHAAIETGKTTLAAERLGISQPAVSRAIAQLEARAGRPLFSREGAGLSPTADALAIYAEINTIQKSLERIEKFSAGADTDARLRIAAPPSVAQGIIDEITAKFMLQNPAVRVTVDVVTTPQVLEHIADGRSDVGIADLPDSDLPLQVRRMPYRQSRYICALPEGHALAGKAVITAADLDGVPMIGLVRRNAARAMIDRSLSRQGSTPNVVVETSAAISGLTFVAQGIGVLIFNPFPVALVPHKGIVLRPFEPPIHGRLDIFLSQGDRLNPLALRYVEFIKANQPADDEYSWRAK
ncbi:LysR family transcriptional regulator [Devosia sp. YIM 151766]|uniref:LysR family transcriptional regulator n=1 Tax=Devosia sp. YIM 151766 TaxID=3017325 RepID=UPI00255C95A8|nr:LysR family transcriptional regulator [Devosia sp. YIM 151766]WIY53898.1 LysR family transcriptional regulator [Devosia sp. YIM 151766]